jgi:hypothetical protein
VRLSVRVGVMLIAVVVVPSAIGQTRSGGRALVRPANTPFTTIDMVPRDAYAVMERANSLDAICGRAQPDPECVRKVLTARTYVIQLYTAPADSSPSAGVIVMTATPGQGLTNVEYIAPSEAHTRMTPDDGVGDWGYGSPFRYTVLERRENWVKLPRRPFPAPVWVDAERALGHIDLASVAAEDLYTFREDKLFILDVLKNSLRVRDEQENDMCFAGPGKPVVKPFRPRELKLDELYDADGHFLMTQTYPRGC